MVEEDIEIGNVKHATKLSSFEVIPKILVFQLQRAQFDQQMKESFKSNSNFKFPQHFALDRFLSINLSSFGAIRQKVVQLQIEKQKLQSSLAPLEKYQGKKSSLVDMLEGTLDFAKKENAPAEVVTYLTLLHQRKEAELDLRW